MRPIIPRYQPPEDLAGGPHSEPYAPYRLGPPSPDIDAAMEANRHERILENSQLGGMEQWAPFRGYGSNAGPSEDEQAYARALAGGLPDAPEEIPQPRPFRVTS